VNIIARRNAPQNHGLVVRWFFVIVVLWGWSGLAHATSGEAHVPDPCDRAATGAEGGIRENTGQRKRPNVLLIGIETLRADHVGCLGYKKDTTPTFDQLAKEGVLCTRTMSTSGWTLPSVMSVMTSLYPSVHRVQTYQNRLSGEINTLAEILKAAGYATFGVISNPTIEGQYGFSQGFDLYDDFTVSLDFGMDVFGNNDKIIGDRHLSRSSELVTTTAVKWLQRKPAEPFFMFTFYFDPHYDYIPPAPFDTMFDPNYEGHIDGRGINDEPRRSTRPSDRDLQHLLALYDGEIRYTDGYVAQLLETMAQLGLLENTLVVLFGDHGDEFYEHGKTSHARTLYNEIVHVPLILRWPGRLPAGKRIEAVASLVDIAPTVLDYITVSYEGPMQGISLRPLIEGQMERSRDTVWAELSNGLHAQALIGGARKLLRGPGNDAWEFYDLQNDPGEHTNLYDQPSAAEARAALMAEWERWAQDNQQLSDRLAKGKEAETIEPSEQQLQQLKALGYVQ
jgi:arylsulfatase A-like enzyme